MTKRLPMRYRLSDAWARFVYWYEGVQFDLGLGERPDGAIPHAVKRRMVRDYGKRFRLRTRVETGTHIGHMVAAMHGYFDQIYSVELGRHLYERANARLADKPNVHLYCGDSASTLPDMIAALPAPALFWLDAHYSGDVTARGDIDTPIVAELQRILGHDRARHVVLIDDARSFGGTDGYPTPQELRRIVGELRPDYEMTIADDVIRIVPSGSA
jgi:hypothetical protein